jgi:hypothetical protein
VQRWDFEKANEWVEHHAGFGSRVVALLSCKQFTSFADGRRQMQSLSNRDLSPIWECRLTLPTCDKGLGWSSGEFLQGFNDSVSHWKEGWRNLSSLAGALLSQRNRSLRYGGKVYLNTVLFHYLELFSLFQSKPCQDDFLCIPNTADAIPFNATNH